MTFHLESIPSQIGKIAIVTGGNNGLGFETTLGLAKKQIKVIMACRSLQKAKEAKLRIEKIVPGADIDTMFLDLSKFASVRFFASEFLTKYSRLDLLINNAGIMVPPFEKTADGLESQMEVNYFSHFLLTGLLFEMLKKSPGSRVVSLSSIAHKNADIDFNNLNSEKSYSRMKAYGQSKLACLVFAYELQRRIDAKNEKVISVAAHPGVSPTNLFQHLPKIVTWMIKPFSSFISHLPESAALPTLYAALGNDVYGGEFIGPTGFREMKGQPGKVTSSKISYDTALATNLWSVSEKLTMQKFEV